MFRDAVSSRGGAYGGEVLTVSIWLMTRSRFLALLLLAAALALAACGDGDDEGDGGDGDEPDTPEAIVGSLKENAAAFEYEIGEPGGTITSSTIGEPLTFNLALANDAYSAGLLGLLFDGLTKVSWLTDEVEPALAESWEHSEDGLTWTFSLRRDVTWHDGQPFTAHDVDFTFNRIIYNEDIPTNTRAAFIFRFLEDGEWVEDTMTVTAVDDYTVRFVLPTSFAPFIRSMGTAIYPRHILEPHVDGGAFNSVWGIDADPATVIGTGPFTIERYTPGERVVLLRNPNYWLKDAEGNSLPYIETVVHLLVDDIEAELALFEAGETDVHGVTGEEYAGLKPLEEDGNFTIYRRGPAFGTTFLAFNQNPGSNAESGAPYVAPEKLTWFSNQPFRQAVAHAIDKERIVAEVMHDLGYPQWAAISPAAGDFHNPDVRKYEYDVEAANDILDSLGWTDSDGDGVREDGAGNPIEFSLITNEGNTVREQVAMRIAEGLAALGLKANYQAIDFGDVVERLVTSYEWEAVVIGLTGGTEPHDGMGVWHSSADLHLWNPKQEAPATDWEAQIDELYILGSQELDREKRVEHYRQAQAIAAQHVPLIYTTLSERLSAVRNVFGNTTPTLYGLWDIRYLYRTDN